MTDEVQPKSMARQGTRGALMLACWGLGGCRDAPLSSFVAASEEAQASLSLLYWMAGVGAVIWVGVVALAIYATRARPGPHSNRGVKLLLFGGGVVLPVTVLSALLVYGLSVPLPLPGRAPDVRVQVVGERWWWRVRYLDADGGRVELANELRLPGGRRVDIELSTSEVIHSLWVPALGGKQDLLPGRVNYLSITPTRSGTYRGACAEFCGDGHANMGLVVEVMPAAAFEQWRQAQRAEARVPTSAAAARGAAVFQSRGCAVCHTVRGTPARGSIGPDLTHVGSRHSLAAGMLPVEKEAFAHWVTKADSIKPAALMPSIQLPPDELDDLASYLVQLQ